MILSKRLLKAAYYGAFYVITAGFIIGLSNGKCGSSRVSDSILEQHPTDSLLEEFDADHDGYLDKHELRHLLERGPYSSQRNR